jgi:hypothetical protein
MSSGRIAQFLPLHQCDHYTPPDHRSRPLQAAERDVVSRIEDTVNLGKWVSLRENRWENRENMSA